MKEVVYNCCNNPRVQAGSATTTLTYHPPIFDKYGFNTNRPRDGVTTECQCLNCGRYWEETR